MEQIEIVSAYNVNGNKVYPITCEDAIILKDGTLLSDKLSSLKTAEEISKEIQRKFEEIDEKISGIETTERKELVFSDDEDIQFEFSIDVVSEINDIKKEISELKQLVLNFTK